MNSTVFPKFVSLLLLTSATMAPGQVLLSKTFSGEDDGGFTATNENGASGGPWVYNTADGTWSVNGDASGTPTSNELTSQSIAAPAGTALRVTITHRYSFETEWDGAVIQYSTDGGTTYQTVSKDDFRQNAYTFNSLIGNHVLKDQAGFNGDSPGYAARWFITSVADIPALAATGDVLIRFLGAWDEGAQGSLPNWEIDSVKVETLLDSNGNGLPDGWESTYGVTDPAADPDGDGLTNLAEYQKFTNPTSGDTDGDGLKDGVETGTGVWAGAADTGTQALLPDTDADGLPDGVETNTGTFTNATSTGTNPHSADTDGDLIADGLEIRYGSNPVNKDSTPLQPGVPSLLAWWNFNDSTQPLEATDSRVGLKATLEAGAAYTEDAEGRSGTAGDKAVSLPGGASPRIQAVTADFLNIGARADKLSFTFWQRINAVANSNSFWAYSPSTADQRGAQAHAPWGDGTIYFDTAGCCGGPTRISGTPVQPDFDFTVWHHYAFVKNGPVKEVWVDGELAFSGSEASPLPADFNALRFGGGASAAIDGDIDDFAVFGSALSQNDIQRLVDGETPAQISVSADADADGLPDSWEYLYFPSDLVKLKGGQDFDADGVKDEMEFALDTNPTNDDTDGDGVKDGAETGTGIWVSLANRGTDPKKADTDGDGLTDAIETNSGVFTSAADSGTSPLKMDTDDDTFPDALELVYGTSPVLKSSAPFPAGTTALLAWWSFNSTPDDVTVTDSAHSFQGAMEGGAFLTEDAGGQSGAAGDRALTLPGRVNVENGGFLNAAVPADAMTFSFWQLRYDSGQSSFWAFSPSSTEGERGFQAHAPWTDGNIYFDSAGCCVANVTRISGPVPEGFDADGPVWHHFAFVKNGAEKSVWVDGDQVMTGNGAPLPGDFYKLFIGSANTGNGINGLIDDFAVYAGGLTETQISRLAKGERPDAVLAAVPPAASFSITSVTRTANGAVTLVWESSAGTTYTIEGSVNTQQWTAVQQNIAGADGSTSITLTTLPAAPYFLRIRK